MFVIGIDPGLTRCGFAVVRGDARSSQLLRFGTLRTDATAPVEDRLGELCRDLDALYEEFPADAVAVEKVFFQKNALTAQGVSQASGLAVGLASRRGMLVRQYTSQEAKLAITGYGAATKIQMQERVTSLCGLASRIEPADAADAVALALTHLIVAHRDLRFQAAQ
jgi:crossover junction endodeoxyribonuclease RuvC